MISEILGRYDTDKVNPHTYGAAYDELFGSFDSTDSLNILEVGTQKGGSLCAWKEYFPNATVTGLDIVDVVKPEYKRDGIKYILCDVNDYKTDEMFDIVIDDGSHWLKDVIHTVAYFSRKLTIGGVIVIEDIQNFDVWLPAISNILSKELEYNKGYTWVTASVNNGVLGFEDDCLIVIKRIPSLYSK